MTLGAKLREIIKAENAAKIEAERKALEEKEKQRLKIRIERQQLIDDIRYYFNEQITRGKKPEYKITAADMCSWINGCERDYTPIDKDIWDNFINWLKSEDLRIKIIKERHSARTDWNTICAEPTPEPEIEAD